MEGRGLEKILQKLAEKENTNSEYTVYTNIISELQQSQRTASLAQQFYEWLQTQDHSPTTSGTELLLQWYLNAFCSPSSKTYPDIAQDYKLYLNIAQVAVEKNYLAAVDVPISEEEFKNRLDLINFFTQWINDKKENRWSDTDNLLFWYKLHDKQQTYEGFLALAQLAAKRGYQTAEVTLTAEEYDARFKNSVETMRKLITKMYDPLVQAINYKFYKGSGDTIFSALGQGYNTRQEHIENSSAKPPKVRRV